jgi:D-glycero-alpha-D-manno-heptose-7-phosphate kinase
MVAGPPGGLVESAGSRGRDVSTITTAEATAPTRIDLAGGLVAVAIDRRPHCRVEAGGGLEGVRLESKDALVKVEGPELGALPRSGSLALAVHVLEVLGIERGLRLTTHSRVPAGSGLAEAAALALAVAASAAQATGRHLGPDALAEVAAEAVRRATGSGAGLQAALAAALHGGVVAVHLVDGAPRSSRLTMDPGRVEESLLLVDAGSGPLAAPAAGDEGDAGAAARLAEALSAHRYDDVPTLIDAEWEARRSRAPGAASPEIDRVVEAARAHGGAARASGGTAGLVTAWCPPRRRPALEAALRASGARLLSFRLDLRGLEVE